MKRKYYRIREYLYGYEAAEYLGALTGVSLDSDDFFRIVNSHLSAYIDCLNEPFIGGEVDGLPLKVVPVGLQKVHSHLHWFNDSELRFCFNPPKSFLERDKPFHVDLEGVISVDSWFDEVFSSWRAEGGFLYLAGAALVFLPTDVEALAAKMNDEPDYQVLQEENQHLRQEIEALKAEVERLQVESSALKQVGGGATQELGFTHITDNLKLVAATQQEFYDDDFDINDKQTHPTRNFIKDWLRDKHGVVSDETRKAIERIATPFSRDRAKK